MTYKNIFLNALLSSQENKGNPSWWSRGRTMGRGRGEIGDEERQGKAGGVGNRRRRNPKAEQSSKQIGTLFQVYITNENISGNPLKMNPGSDDRKIHLIFKFRRMKQFHTSAPK